MMHKMTVLALLALLLCASANDRSMHDQMRDQMGNMGMNNNPYNQNLEKINQEVAGAIAVVYIIAFFILAAINIFLCVKCLKKRAVSNGIKEQIQMKRMQFATMHGLDMQTLNNPRYSQTIHV